MDNTNINNTRDKGLKGPLAYMARNSIAANLLMLILIGGGIWSAYNMQKEVFPQFALDIVEVSVVYPGAAPSEVEKEILLPVEEAIRGVQGIKEVTFTAREGSGSVSIELVAGTNRMKAFQDIDQAVNRIRAFPDDIEEPGVRLQSRQRDVMEIVFTTGIILVIVPSLYMILEDLNSLVRGRHTGNASLATSDLQK